jgi:phosphatidylglycerol:prolipoprotein diacylglycerol transferase
MPDIWFPHLGIKISHLSRTAFSIGQISIAWYGIIITCAFICGYLIAAAIAKRSDQKPDFYLDFFLIVIITGIVGARIYYVAFAWDSYKDNLLEILNLRNGGLAIYGGVLACVLAAVVYKRVKKASFLLMADTCLPGLALGQAIGRWGNFCNQEAFGGYTDSLFAMRLNVETAYYTTPELLSHSVTVDGTTYIQVHPTFLYESFGCLVLVLLMLWVWKRKKYNGQVACVYFIGYGLLRSLIETLRTDQLLLWNTSFPVSILVSLLMAFAGFVLALVLRRNYHRSVAAAVVSTVSDAAVEGAEAEEESTHDLHQQ